MQGKKDEHNNTYVVQRLTGHEGVIFDWLMPLSVATQVKVTWEKFLATLRDALRKVELTSTFRNDCGNKKVARNVCSRVCYTRQYFVQLVSQQNCETSRKRNCLV